MAGKKPSTVSFADNIRPYFQQYLGQMRWRFDLMNYEQVRDNAELIYGQIAQKMMPPPPFSPFADEFIKSFKTWMDQDYPK
jgi:hypothetical protein